MYEPEYGTLTGHVHSVQKTFCLIYMLYGHYQSLLQPQPLEKQGTNNNSADNNLISNAHIILVTLSAVPYLVVVVHCWGTDWTVDQLSLQHLQS